MALPHPDVNAVLRFPAKLGTSHKKAPQNLFKTPFAPSNFPPRPQARPRLPLRGRWREAPEGETGGAEPSRPYNRLSTAKTLSKTAALGRHLPLTLCGKGAI